MYYVVTGAAGFIGSNLVKALNDRGETNIIAVDHLKNADKFKNLTDCEIADFIDKEDFIARMNSGSFDGDLQAVLIGRFSQAFFIPLKIFCRSNCSRRPSFLTTIGNISSTYS